MNMASCVYPLVFMRQIRLQGLGKTGEGYHTHEDLFWTGFQGDPTKGKPADQSWYGMSNLVVDKTPITSEDFNTSFNTGHGKHWFVDGKISKEGEWNYRSVSGYLQHGVGG